MLLGTVGVAPGSYTLQLGSAPCAIDVNGPVGYGVPSRTWYEGPNAWFSQQFNANGYGTLPGIVSSTPPPPPSTPIAFDPYGTDSTLRGRLGDPPTVLGLRVDVLGAVAAAALGVGLLISHFARR